LDVALWPEAGAGGSFAPAEIDPVHRLLAFSLAPLSRGPPGTRMPIRCSTGGRLGGSDARS
jgi:hypothetical protein